MALISKIRTINSRVRRGDRSQTTRGLLADIDQLGLLTPSGYISKSKKALSSKKLDTIIGYYENEFDIEKRMGNLYGLREKINSLVHAYVADSDYYQVMRNDANGEDDFVQKALELIEENDSDFPNFTNEEMELIEDYLRESYRDKHLLSKARYKKKGG